MLALITCETSAANKAVDSRAGTQQQDKTTDENTAFDIFADGKLFVDYRKAGFIELKNTIMPSLKSADGHTTIGFVSCTDNCLGDNDLSVFEDYKDKKGYKYEELVINGNKATRVAYYDDVIYSNYVAKVYIKFGANAAAKPYTGVVVTVTNDQSVDNCCSPDVMEVIKSLRFK